VGIVVLAGNQLSNSLSGIGDAPAYVRLADSLYAGKGFSYVGQPSAFRPPLYPLLLAGAHVVFGKYYLLAIRILQLLAGIATAWISARTAATVWGPEAHARCFAWVLVFPTLLYFTGEILTEAFASLLTVSFFYFLVRTDERRSGAVGMGVVSGIACLLRFNTIFFPLVAAWRIFSSLAAARRWRALLAVAAIPLTFLMPWMIRNLIVFDGQVIYSTHTGMDLVEGILEPEGRADKEQQQEIIRQAGWVMQGLEREDARRLLYPSEPVLNQHAMAAAKRLWMNAGWEGVVVMVKKIGYFWLSADQFKGLATFSFHVRLVRLAGVLVYWAALVMSCFGIRRLYRIDPRLAVTFIIYFSIATCLHLLFAMNTRLRVPLVDPLLCVLMSFPFRAAEGKRGEATRIEVPVSA